MICFEISNLKFKIVLAFVAIVLLFANTNKIYAQSLSLSLSPPLLEVFIQPNQSITQTYKLTNNSATQLQITPIISLFKPSGNKGEIKISNQDLQSLTNDIYFSFDSGEKMNEPITIAVGQTKEIVFRITTLPKTTEKDYYCTLLFSSGNPKIEEDKTQVYSVGQIGTNILITVSSSIKLPLLARILKFSAPTIIDSFSPTQFDVLLENWGKNFWKPFGKISIEGILKQKGEINLCGQNVLSNSQRQLTIDPYRPNIPLGPFKARLEFSLNEAAKTPDSDGQQLSSGIVFWYIPYKILLVLLLLLILVKIYKKIKRKRQNLPAGRQENNPAKSRPAAYTTIAP